MKLRQRKFSLAAGSALVHGSCVLPCLAQSTSGNSHAGGGDATFFGMSTNVAILVMVLISVVVIGIMLFVLQRQCKARKQGRLVSRIIQSRRRGSTQTNEYVAPMVTVASEGDDTDSDTSVQELVENGAAVESGRATTHTGNRAAAGGEDDATPLQRNPLDAATACESFAALGDLDTPDAESVRSSTARVAHWLGHSVVPPPPPESPQFVTLRASSFLGAKRSDGTANGQPPEDVYVRGARAASCLVVDHNNGALQLTYSLPPAGNSIRVKDRNETRSPQSAASDPFR